MTAILNEDILTLIFAHIFDFAVLRTAAVAIKNSNQHPLRSVVLRRLLQLPLRLSSENLEDSKALIKNLVHNVGRAQLVRDIAIVLGPSRKYIAERQEFHNARLAEDLKQAERAEALVESIPELLKQTTNVWHLDWSDSPPPNRETVEELSKNSAFTHLSLDCSAESFHLPDPSKPVGVPGTATGIRTLLSTVGPKVPSLDLRNVDEEVFKVIEQELPPLKNVQNLKLDLTCGVWDWDGSGSPQQGPSEHYRFSRASDHVQKLDLRLTDLLARQKKGPLELVDSKKLRKLTVEIVPCFSWTCITLVRLFSDLTSANFPSLTHLVIDDFIRDAKRWSISGELGPADWHEGGRIYVGIHELIASLPQLRHLWVNERVLAVPSTDNEVDVWDLKPFEGESQDTIMLHTVNSPYWESLVRAFENLETLRVGFGQLNAKWVARVLSHCDHTRLKAFGFDWEWQSIEPGAFSELIATLSRFESLTDLHILHPSPALPTPTDYRNYDEARLAILRVHESEEIKGLVKELLSGLPGLYRVGIGRNSVWERQTRWKEGDSDEFHVQKLHEAEAPPFYDAGSCHPFIPLGKGQGCPAIKDVLKLLEEL